MPTKSGQRSATVGNDLCAISVKCELAILSHFGERQGWRSLLLFCEVASFCPNHGLAFDRSISFGFGESLVRGKESPNCFWAAARRAR